MSHPRGIYVAGCRCAECEAKRRYGRKSERMERIAAQMREYNRLHTPGTKRTA